VTCRGGPKILNGTSIDVLPLFPAASVTSTLTVIVSGAVVMVARAGARFEESGTS
jgi:hypothetical protein